MNNELESIVAQYEGATKMSAIAMTDFPQVGRVIEQLKMIEVPVPRPQEREVIIKMLASSLYADELYAAQGTALGHFFGPKVVSESEPYIMGSSVSGIVVALGGEVTDLSIGQPVITIPSQTPTHGTWADYCCIPRERVLPKPGALSSVEAAAMKMPAAVVWGAIEHAELEPGMRTLVIGASGGLGIMAVQYLKSLGAHVTGVCSGKNRAMVLRWGADEVVDYTTDNFADLALASGQKYDRVFDFVGGMDAESSGLRALERSGRFITVTGPEIYIGEKKLTWSKLVSIFSHIAYQSLRGRLLGPRYIFGEMNPSKTIRPALKQALDHEIHMPVSEEVPFSIDRVQKALQRLMSHRAQGRMVINYELD